MPYFKHLRSLALFASIYIPASVTETIIQYFQHKTKGALKPRKIDNRDYFTEADFYDEDGNPI